MTFGKFEPCPLAAGFLLDVKSDVCFAIISYRRFETAHLGQFHLNEY